MTMPSEFKKRACGPEGPLYVIVATEEQKWVNQEFLWRKVAGLAKREGLTQRRKDAKGEGRREEEEGRGDWEPRGRP